MSSVVETVTEMAIPILDEQHFGLAEAEFIKEGKSWFLRVFIDKEGGIGIEGCAFVNEKLSEKPNVANLNPIPRAYFLEAPPLRTKRPLKRENDYERVLGDYVYVSLYQPIDGEKQYEGFL